ncbi:gamma-glutamyl-gamma-aminobutyrate hydrolase family protein [Kitasatospora sp. NBC_01302]|nr:gamma-glutamyl-gamma-aminobutyrate hydrolase family protein [Kitasatospora sp. NBC_01302]WSJ66212.1 gamma-glutamyl-gamma-aminobutyrate hydrolase family protein [Kitasatospora sp. NBC_01302]
MQPRIGITARLRRSVQSHCVHQAYVDQVARAGGVPIVIPFGDEKLCEPVLSALDGLLLTGGEDIDPAYADGTPRQPGYDYHPDRDAFELRLAALALAAGVPVLGICRGCQVLHVATGNRLIPDIPEVTDGSVAHRLSLTEPSRHLVTLAAEGVVARAYGERSRWVTSYHHQGLTMPEAPDARWRATAHSEDSLVEAIEQVEGGWAVGVLWHPELPATTNGGEIPVPADPLLPDSLPADPLLPDSLPADPLISAFVTAARQPRV